MLVIPKSCPYFAAFCGNSPTITSRTNQFSSSHPAEETLTDGVHDATGNYWEAEYNRPAGFVIDLGCPSVVAEVHLRNSHDGSSNNM